MSRRRRPQASTANDPAIGARVRAQRNARRITQFALADALGITYEQLRKYETGRSPISARRLQQVATLLDVPVAAFTCLDSKATQPRRRSFSLLDSADAMRLMRAYTALATPRMRRALVTLAERMAGVRA